jgi:class 3 adenylate cyclase/HAMP domain-containing protein
MEEKSTQRREISVSLRVKIILAFCALSALVSVALALSTYQMLNRNLFQELRSRVRDLTEIGSLLLDRGALKRLVGRVAEGLSEERVAAVEQSADFRLISDQLNRIRAVEPNLVRYIYTYVPTADPNKALFLVDGDVLEDTAQLEKQRQAGEEVDEKGISHFASEFDVSEFPVARQAIREKRNLVEESYSYDAEFKVNSISGYAALPAEDGQTLLAVLGLDMVDTDVRAVLSRTTTLSFLITGIALLLAIGTSIGVGTAFTRGIISLDRVVRSFGEKNLHVRARIRSRDEVGRLGLSFNRMAEIIQQHSAQMETLLGAYGRFVPHDFLRFLQKESIVDVRLGDQVEREMTVLFSDIRSFTELSESMTPEQNFRFLNSYLSRIGPEIRTHGGFIDKYIGDAIMALFPTRPDDAVKAAVAMRHKLREYNRHRASSGYAPVEVGIALNTGRLMLGTVGEQERMDGSVIADTVNLASRLEGLSRLYGNTILITGPTLSLLDNPRQYHTRFVDRVRVRGRKEPVLIYELYDWALPEEIERRHGLRPKLTEALNLYYGKDFVACFRQLRLLQEKDPEDPIIDLYLRRCALLIRKGVPEGWQGVEVIDLK